MIEWPFGFYFLSSSTGDRRYRFVILPSFLFDLSKANTAIQCVSFLLRLRFSLYHMRACVFINMSKENPFISFHSLWNNWPAYEAHAHTFIHGRATNLSFSPLIKSVLMSVFHLSFMAIRNYGKRVSRATNTYIHSPRAIRIQKKNTKKTHAYTPNLLITALHVCLQRNTAAHHCQPISGEQMN